MIRYGIAKFTGLWVSASGNRLEIKKVDDAQALVDFFDATGNPVCRPYMNDAPSVRMVAHYDDYNGIFGVELWEQGRGYILDLTHEYDYELDERRREALVPAISRYEQDRFLDQYSRLFGSLDHFVRARRRTRRSIEPAPSMSAYKSTIPGGRRSVN